MVCVCVCVCVVCVCVCVCVLCCVCVCVWRSFPSARAFLSCADAGRSSHTHPSTDVPYDIVSDFPALGQRSSKTPEFSLGQEDFPTLGSRGSNSRTPGFGASSGATSSSGGSAMVSGGPQSGVVYESGSVGGGGAASGASGVGSGGLASLRAGSSPSQAPGGPTMSTHQVEHGAVGSPSVMGGVSHGGVHGAGAVGSARGGSPGGAAQTRYGLLGLLSVIQYTDQDLNTLALGVDLTTLGLNLNSSTSLYSTFASPFADKPARRSPEFHLPLCYYIPMQPATAKMNEFSDETLFYMFYNLPRDRLQLAAARELYVVDASLFGGGCLSVVVGVWGVGVVSSL
jgi:CCR4-NOT transcription complex subunit 2